MREYRSRHRTRAMARALASIGVPLALVACGSTAGPHRTAVATAPAPPTVAATDVLPPSHGIAPVEEAGSGTTCPDGYPIKADDTSGRYFRPDQRAYDATNARHCFVSEATARTAGYRASQE